MPIGGGRSSLDLARPRGYHRARAAIGQPIVARTPTPSPARDGRPRGPAGRLRQRSGNDCANAGPAHRRGCYGHGNAGRAISRRQDRAAPSSHSMGRCCSTMARQLQGPLHRLGRAGHHPRGWWDRSVLRRVARRAPGGAGRPRDDVRVQPRRRQLSTPAERPRTLESMLSDHQQMVDQLVAQGVIQPPFILAGHSLGAISRWPPR